MKILLTIILLTIFITKGNCQNKYSAPGGYSIYKSGNKQFRLDKDFDNDGLKDVVIIYAKDDSENDHIVSVYLSTRASGKKPFHSFPFNADEYTIQVKNKILIIGTCIAKVDYCRTLQFKYYPGLKNLRLIGYTEQSVGNAIAEGGYFKSVNMVTRFFELSGPLWKNKIREKGHFPIITLSDIDQATLEKFETIGAKYF